MAPPLPPPSTQPLPAHLNDYSGGRLLDLSVAFIVINTIVLTSRQICRSVLKKGSFGADDILIPLSWLFCTGMWVIGVVQVKLGGVGRHIQWVLLNQPDALTVDAKCIFALEYLYLCAVSLTKLSILYLYLRVFVDRKVRLLIWVLAGYIVSFGIVACIVNTFQAWPVQYVWNPNVVGGYHPFDEAVFLKVIGPMELAPDLPMLLLPAWSIWKLNMSGRKKLVGVVVLSAGIVGTVIGTVRTVVFFDSSIFIDMTWEDVPLSIWGAIEPSMYFIAACLPGCYSLLEMLTYDKFCSLGNGVINSFTGNRSPSNNRLDNNDSNKEGGLRDSEDSRLQGWAHRKNSRTRLVEDSLLETESNIMLDKSYGVWIRRNVVVEEHFGN